MFCMGSPSKREEEGVGVGGVRIINMFEGGGGDYEEINSPKNIYLFFTPPWGKKNNENMKAEKMKK